MEREEAEEAAGQEAAAAMPTIQAVDHDAKYVKTTDEELNRTVADEV